MKKLSWIFAVAIVLATSSVALAEVAAPKVIAAKFHADWCGSCKIMGPAIEKVKKEFNQKDVLFVRFDRTDEATSHDSELLASAIGFAEGYAAFEGTGKVLLIDAQSKEVLGKLTKDLSPEQMTSYINQALAGEKIADDHGDHKGSMHHKGSHMEKKGS